ncbi:MAG: DUF4173 domain-containing protein [Phenylobacterium zucineum]|nr:MAG: DUF4173 domain-containing protein [Phenylobacterium zucineum]
MASHRWSFWTKVLLLATVVAAADGLIFIATGLGANLGLVGLAWAGGLALAVPAVRGDRLGRIALAFAALFALLQIERATLLGWVLFLIAIGVAALAPRAGRVDDAWRWFQRLVVGGFMGLIGPVRDVRRVLRARGRRRNARLVDLLLVLALPVLGGGVFVALFAQANPVIEQTLDTLRLPEPDVRRIAFWAGVAVVVWAALRPGGLRRPLALPGLDRELTLPGVTTASITLSLAVFNAIFAVQNGLDLAYLWGGLGLPEGTTFAEYAHRGAYPLIATALLAGLFVLVFLRPGSATASDRRVRWLVTAWVAQNLFLVASTALRTLDYVEAYSLTRMRIAALLWMGLVAIGLALILWRLLRGRSAAWLINANALTAGLVLAFCSVADLGAIAAAWNVRHAREVGGAGVDLDLCYMQLTLGGASLVPLARLEASLPSSEFRDRVSFVRQGVQARVTGWQSDWREWRWRDARRLAEAERITGPTPPLLHERRDCGGRLLPAMPVTRAPAPAASQPLTPNPKP